MSENFSVCFFIVLSYLVICCWKDVLCSSDIMWLWICDWIFPLRKKKTFLWEDFVQLIIISSYMTYAFSCLGTLPFCIFIPWTWSRQQGELSTKASFPSQLTVYIHCFMWIRCLKNQQPGLSLHFHCHFFLHSLAHKRKKSWLQVTSRQHLLRTLCKHILYMV